MRTPTTSSKLLSRAQFFDRIWARDSGKCVVCGQPGVDAHHLLDRSLWADGGYYAENGVLLCTLCHQLAESNDLSVEYLRTLADLPCCLPPQYPAGTYDKWGHSMDHVIKYPRTMHLPWSPGLQNDDRVIETLDGFVGEQIIVTEKMDGEGTSMYCDWIHARSPSMLPPHPSRSYVKQLWDRVKHDIPPGWRVCGENLYAKHSIHYQNLTDYFQVFSIWDGSKCLDWYTTLEWCELLGLTPVPWTAGGLWDDLTKTDWDVLGQEVIEHDVEGYVVRTAKSFDLSEFPLKIAKYVRKGHVQTDQHWMFQPVVHNGLRK